MGDAEIGDLEGPVLGQHEYVGGLDVAVNDAALMRVVQGFGQLYADRQHLLERHGLAGLHRLAQRYAVDQLDDDVRPVADLSDVVDGHDVGMREGAGGLGLAYETADVLLVEAPFLLEDLERQRAVDLRVVGLVDLGHRALADQLDDLVAAYLLKRRLLDRRVRCLNHVSKHPSTRELS